MAFFCPGSGGAKIKKEYENHSRRHYEHQQSGVHSPSQFHRPSSGGYPVSPQVPPGRTPMFDRVNESNNQPPVSTQFFQKMIILHDHYPKREMELSVRKGEKVEVVKKEVDWLFVRNERGKEGYVPSRNCVAPVTRRPRSNSRSSVPIRPVMSGEVLEGANGRVRSGSGVPMYSSSSAGKVRRYDSPMSVCDFERDNVSSTASFQRIASPPSILYNNESSTEHTTFDTKCSLSSSSGVSLMDTSSPGLTRAFSHEELKPPYTEVHSMYSLSQSAVDPSINGDNKPIIGLRNAHHKHSSSDDSGTVDSTHLRDPVDYASTIRNDESSTEDVNLTLERIPSGGTMTPSMRDRPLPSPPKSNGTNTAKEETPPPIPPRNTSLDTSRLRGSNVPPPVPPPTEDDRNPYAQPVDSIPNGSDRGKEGKNQRVHSMLQKQQQHHQGGSIRAIIDISDKNSGVDAPYSEVYRSEKRPINVHELRDSPMASKKFSNGRSKHRSTSGSAIARRHSPLVNGGSDHNSGDEVGGKPEERRPKGIVKFRKNLWGVFICMKDFDGIDENEVSVKAGEQVLVFNQDDQFWYWVVKHKTDQSEGFVPASILREDDKKQPPSGDLPIGSSSRTRTRSTNSPPAVPPRNDSRQRVHTISSSLLSSSSMGGNHSHRNRVRSISSTMSNTNSIEKVPIDSDILRTSSFGPSSPPPPYAEQDPILHPSQSHDKHMTSNSHSVQQGGGIVRNRPPTYPRSGRSSTSSQMYPPPSSGSGVYPGYVSQSASRLNHPHSERFYQEHQNSYPCSPVASTGGGGTLV